MILHCTSKSGTLASCLPKQSLCLWIIHPGHYQWIIKGLFQAYLSKNLWGCHLVVLHKWRAAYAMQLQTCEHCEHEGDCRLWALTASLGAIISTVMSISSSFPVEAIYLVDWKTNGSRFPVVQPLVSHYSPDIRSRLKRDLRFESSSFILQW